MGSNVWLVDKQGKSFPVQQPRTRIGRDSQNQIVLADAQVSRFHATILIQGGRLYIRDEQSKNGTWVNGARISSARMLQIGDRVRVGGVELTVSTTPGKGPVIAPRQSSTVSVIAIGVPLVLVFLCLIGFAALQNQPRDSVARMISAAQGGSIWLMDGTRVDIPPSALVTDTQITISIPKNPPDFGGLKPVPSTVFREFGPSDIKFLKPVKITLPYGSMDMSDALAPDAVFVARWDGKTWEYMESQTVDSMTKAVSAEIDTFSTYVAIKIPSYRMLSFYVEMLLASMIDKQTSVDTEGWTEILTSVYPHYNWEVRLYSNPQMPFWAVPRLGERYRIIVTPSWYNKQNVVTDLPRDKQRLLGVAFLFHEAAHHLNGDTDQAGALLGLPGELARKLRVFGELLIRLLNGDMQGVWESFLNVDTPIKSQIDRERDADKDGFSAARNSIAKWYKGKSDGGDIGVQLALVVVHYWMSVKTNPQDTSHPPPRERAQNAKRNLLQNSDGGLYGKVRVNGSLSSGVRITARNGVWTETDQDGKYLLAPVPASNKAAYARWVTLSKLPECREVAVPIPDSGVPEQDLVRHDFIFDCIPPALEIAFSANPDRINRGEYSMLRWDVKYATKIYVDDKEVAARDTLRVNPDQTRTYTLRAIGLDGKSKEVQVTVTVIQPPLTIMFSADTQQIESGKCATLQWEVKNARSVSLNSNLVSPQGSQQVCPTQTTVYTLRAEGLDGSSDSRSVTISVTQPPPPPPVIIQPPIITNPGGYYIRFWADSTSINYGSCTTLRWDVEGVREVYLGNEGVVGHGSRWVCPKQTTTYRLNVVLVNGGIVTRSVTIYVSSGGCQ